jgi:hypothetical protein
MWIEKLKADPRAWLLEHKDPGVHFLAHRTIPDVGESHFDLKQGQVEAIEQGPIGVILKAMEPEGYWVEPGPGYLPKYRSIVWSLLTLAQLGATIEMDPRIKVACDYIYEHALNRDGQFSSTGPPSGTVDCLQGNLCAALLDLGSQDDRLEIAFDWMARTVTGDGLAPNTDRKAQLRYYAGKCGPGFACGANGKLPCAWGAAKVMLAFGKLPRDRWSQRTEDAVGEGINFLFSVDPATAAYPCGYSKKPSGNWWKFGFPVYYVTDLLQLVEALAILGYGQDQRLSSAINLIIEKADAQGRWLLEYDYTGKNWIDAGPKKQPSPWVTIRALRTLQLCDT